VDKVAAAVAFGARLAACRAALHAAAAELRLGGAGAAHAAGALSQVFEALLAVWQRLQELQAARAEEEAEVFKSKPRTSTFLNEEVRLLLKGGGTQAPRLARGLPGLLGAGCAAGAKGGEGGAMQPATTHPAQPNPAHPNQPNQTQTEPTNPPLAGGGGVGLPGVLPRPLRRL
jgi:hypothetical protein